MYPFRRTCKEVTALVVAQEDRSLGWQDRLGLRLHLQICKACPDFSNQLQLMQKAMKQWRNYHPDD